MDVGAWLRGLGLGQYEQAFRDNDIDADVLPELTAETSGARASPRSATARKLLAAIAALRADARPRRPAAPTDATPQPDGAARRPSGGSSR